MKGIKRVALVTCAEMPDADVDALPLLEAVRAAGADASWQAWNDPAVDWSRFHSAVIRSTWDYHLDLDGFLTWLRRAGDATEVLNPPHIVRENVDKAYLGRLHVPVVPTVYADQGGAATLERLLEGRTWENIVIKPRVSGGSFKTERFGPARRAQAEGFLRSLTASRHAMIQPFLPSVEGYGERALVWIDGTLTHAVRKNPRFGSTGECVSEAAPIAADEAVFAEKALAPFKKELLYARVDVARDEDGSLRLMELELVEPSLFLRSEPAALARLAKAIAR